VEKAVAGGPGLTELFRKYATDKVDFGPAYEFLLASRRRTVRTVIEVGIGTLIPKARGSMVGCLATLTNEFASRLSQQE
jgi:hypothetical protein